MEGDEGIINALQGPLKDRHVMSKWSRMLSLLLGDARTAARDGISQSWAGAFRELTGTRQTAGGERSIRAEGARLSAGRLERGSSVLPMKDWTGWATVRARWGHACMG